MAEFFAKLFSTDDFPARWGCGTWTAGHGWLHISSDVAVFLAYSAIPFLLAYFVIKKKDLVFPKIFWLFVIFIFACGTVHLIEATIFWHPWYRLSGLAKAVTAVASWATVLALVPVLPVALRLPGLAKLNEELKQSNEALERENIQRMRSERNLRLTQEELERKNQEIEQFVFTISHDLKAPLVTSSGFLAVLEENIDAGNYEAAVGASRRLKRAHQRIQELIDDLLQLSRAGRLELKPGWVNVHELINEICDSVVRQQLTDGNAEVTLAEDLPTVYADRMRLQNVFENLIVNAIKYRESGERARIRIVAERGPGHVRFHVIDEGIGIARQHHEQIFGLFVRLDPKVEGTGVGLAIVRSAVEKHGGKVGVTSDLGAGADFWFTLPTPPELSEKREKGHDGARTL